MRFTVTGVFFSPAYSLEFLNFLQKHSGKKVLLENTNTALALVIRPLWGSGTSVISSSRCGGYPISIMHMGVEVSTRHPSGPSLPKLTTQIGARHEIHLRAAISLVL